MMRVHAVLALASVAFVAALVASACGTRASGPSGTIAVIGGSLPDGKIALISPTSRTTRFATGPGIIVRYDLSPDGDRIAIADFAGVWVTRRDGSHARPILDDAGQQEGAAEIAWSPNGRELVFARSDAVLFTISAEGKNLRQVTSDADQPDWTPDGKKIVFVRHPDRTGSWAGLVSVIGADGRGLRRIVDRGTWNKPRVSPDGATVAFDDGEDIYVAPMKGGNPRLFIRNGYNPVWSPDGRFLAFARPVHVPPEPNADDGVETSRVFIMRVSGGTARAYGPKIGDMCCLSWSR